MSRPKKQHLKKRADGRFCCKYQGLQFMGATEEEALAKREEYKQRAKKGLSTSRMPTVAEYAMEWLPLHKNGVSAKCYNDYINQLAAMCDVIGDKHFMDVTVDDAKRVYAHYEGYSNSTIHRARMLFIALFDTAIENGYCIKNVFRSKFAQPDKGTVGTHRVITQEERALIHSVDHRFRLFALFMLYAGLRKGEAIAIDLDKDIDLRKGVIHVNKAVRYFGNQPIHTTPKTTSGVRDVPLLPILRDAIRGQHGYLAQSAKGEQLTQTAFARGWDSYLHALSVAAGKEISIRCHDLRHSYCTMLRDAGVDMKLAMRWMGHADEKMILKVYDHITDDRTLDGVQKLESRAASMQNGMQEQRPILQIIAG